MCLSMVRVSQVNEFECKEVTEVCYHGGLCFIFELRVGLCNCMWFNIPKANYGANGTYIFQINFRWKLSCFAFQKKCCEIFFFTSQKYVQDSLIFWVTEFRKTWIPDIGFEPTTFWSLGVCHISLISSSIFWGIKWPLNIQGGWSK